MKKLVIITVSLLLASCAKIVTPTGGPKDEKPPNALHFEPENLQTDFDAKTIKIRFDEFFVLNNPNEHVIISPPINNMPEFKVQGKSLIVRFLDTLMSQTTYNIGFSDCIKDFHEGNSIPFFRYIFSTGSAIDSFCMSGVVKNAETHKGESGCLVMLYTQNIDSLPLTLRPDYLTKTDDEGLFAFTHIKEGSYKIFALKDINNNLIYDLPNEAIAFQDDLAVSILMEKVDTASKKTENKDSTLSQPTEKSIANKKNIDSLKIELYLFTKKDTIQKLDKYINPDNGIYHFPYKNRFNNFSTEQLSPIDPVSYLQHINKTQDTVTWYFKEPVPELLQCLFMADSATQDTVLIKPYTTPRTTGRGSTKQTHTPLVVKNRFSDNYYQNLQLLFSYPVKPIDSFNIILIRKQKISADTLLLTFSIPDTFVMSLTTPLTLNEKTSYEIFIRDSVFWGYNGRTNDSLKFSFSTKSEKDYGNLQINFKPERKDLHYIVFLQTANGALLQKEIVVGDKILHYLHLDPGGYKLTAIEDLNQNGVWDTGNYSAHRQPERLIFFEKPINIRGSWDLEEDFIIPASKTDK